VSKSQPLWERARILRDRLLAVPPTAYQQRSLGAAFYLFLDPDIKTVLHQAESVSTCALSRFFNEYDWDTAVTLPLFPVPV
jgi:hypothetical protein